MRAMGGGNGETRKWAVSLARLPIKTKNEIGVQTFR